jgi:hypothetical protein
MNQARVVTLAAAVHSQIYWPREQIGRLSYYPSLPEKKTSDGS